jgi:SAM-dependent methyltransferase
MIPATNTKDDGSTTVATNAGPGTSAKALVRRVVPAGLIRWFTECRAAVWTRATLKGWLLRNREHSEVYGEDYFRMVDSTTGKSAQIMAESIARHLQPESVVDLGCGTGNLISELRSLGIGTLGAEFAEPALAFCRERKLDVTRLDFTDPKAIAEPLGEFDLAVSTEVAIQLPPEAAKHHIAYLCRHADTVLFSSPPCARDRLPKSPQKAEYWASQFAENGFRLDAEISRVFQTEWQKRGTASWFYREPMVFRREPEKAD